MSYIQIGLCIAVFFIIDIVFTFLQVVALDRAVSIFKPHNVLLAASLTFIIYCFYFGVI